MDVFNVANILKIIKQYKEPQYNNFDLSQFEIMAVIIKRLMLSDYPFFISEEEDKNYKKF